MPNTRPAILRRVNLSIPSTTEISSTSSGVIVSMIDPSMGDVRDKPYMSSTLRITPISRAAPIIVLMSLRAIGRALLQSKGTSEKSAAAQSEAVTSAIGATYFDSTRL